MHLIQVCNVGQICGGTAACAWSITRALPTWRHTVLCLSSVTRETRGVFAPVEVVPVARVTDEVLRPLQGDLVLLHNVAPERCTRLRSIVSVQYVHSAGRRAEADAVWACSRWLADRLGTKASVLYQPVPCPPEDRRGPPRGDECLVVGRLCTPTPRKWPTSVIEDYASWSHAIPEIRWEFVGAPADLQASLRSATGGRASFHPAGWAARARLHHWHALLYRHPTLAESYGRTVGEAQWAGCIPVVDARGGFVEQIETEFTGFLCHESADFISALRALQRPARRWSIAAAARTAARARCGNQSFVDSVITLIRPLAEVSESRTPMREAETESAD